MSNLTNSDSDKKEEKLPEERGGLSFVSGVDEVVRQSEEWKKAKEKLEKKKPLFEEK